MNIPNKVIDGIFQLLLFCSDAFHSRMFKHFPKDLLQSLQIKPLTGNYHNWSISRKVGFTIILLNML